MGTEYRVPQCHQRATVYSIYLLIFLLLHGATHGISVPQPEVEPGPHAVEAQSPRHWLLRNFCSFYVCCFNVLAFLSLPLLYSYPIIKSPSGGFLGPLKLVEMSILSLLQSLKYFSYSPEWRKVGKRLESCCHNPVNTVVVWIRALVIEIKEWIDVWCTLEMEFMWIAKGLHVKNEEKEVSRKTKNRAIIWPS